MKPQVNFMNFVHDFHKSMVDYNIQLVYEGEINQAITKAFTALAEKNMDDEQEDVTIKKRVYHVMVESLQNISKHADNVETGEAYRPGQGIFMVGKNEKGYLIMTGNAIANRRVDGIRNILDRINALDKDEIKALYKQQMRETRLSSKGGAGLGFIDIAKKTGNKLDYHFEKLNDNTSFFILKSSIDKKKN
jgi:coenzyme F420-reducing hydrogenase delta subunit